jgi:hypothetical protein
MKIFSEHFGQVFLLIKKLKKTLLLLFGYLFFKAEEFSDGGVEYRSDSGKFIKTWGLKIFLPKRNGLLGAFEFISHISL